MRAIPCVCPAAEPLVEAAMARTWADGVLEARVVQLWYASKRFGRWTLFPAGPSFMFEWYAPDELLDWALETAAAILGDRSVAPLRGNAIRLRAAAVAVRTARAAEATARTSVRAA